MNCVLSKPLILFFAILSVADFTLTWWLIERSGCQVFEDNPVADQLLQDHGWVGLAVFKASTVCVVIAVATIVSRRRPNTARHLLRFGCTAVAMVILHGSIVAQTAKTRDESTAEMNNDLEEFNRDARQKTRESAEYVQLVDSIVDEIMNGKSSLADGAQRLMNSSLTQEPRRQQAIQIRYPGKTFKESLALQIMCRVEIRQDAAGGVAVSNLQEQY